MDTTSDVNHFVFPLGQGVVLINDVALRRDILDVLPLPLAFALDGQWVWMNRAAQDWMAVNGSMTKSPKDFSGSPSPFQAAEPPGSYDRDQLKWGASVYREALKNLEGTEVGSVAWLGHPLAMWAVDQLESCVIMASDQKILWANTAARTRFGVSEASSWDELLELPSWEDISQESRVRQVGDHQLRSHVFGAYVLVEYWRREAPSDATLSLEEVASMVHEIRNPLAALSGYVEMAQMESEGPGSGYYDKMMQEIDRLGRLTSDLMSISRLPVINPQWTALDSIVDNAWLVASQTRHKGRGRKRVIDVKRNYRLDQKVWADPDRLQQVLTNVVKNAVEAMATKGTAVEIDCREEEGALVIVVRDDGPGFPPDLLGKVSRTRFTTKKSGSGLGLMVVRRIVRAHGGTIRIVSDGKTAVELAFPLPS